MNKFKKNFISTMGLFLLFTGICFVSCNQDEVPASSLELRDTLIYKKGETKPYTGHEKARIKDKIIEYDVVNGIKQGDFKLYFLNGDVQIEGRLKDNKNVGLWKYYYDTGELESKGEFENDKPKGEWTWYYPSGKIKERGNYFEGNRIGKWQDFDEAGNVTEEKDFSLQDSVSDNENFPDELNTVKKDQ